MYEVIHKSFTRISLLTGLRVVNGGTLIAIIPIIISSAGSSDLFYCHHGSSMGGPTEKLHQENRKV